jgi:hypothetical protein
MDILRLVICLLAMFALAHAAPAAAQSSHEDEVRPAPNVRARSVQFTPTAASATRNADIRPKAAVLSRPACGSASAGPLPPVRLGG